MFCLLPSTSGDRDFRQHCKLFQSSSHFGTPACINHPIEAHNNRIVSGVFVFEVNKMMGFFNPSDLVSNCSSCYPPPSPPGCLSEGSPRFPSARSPDGADTRPTCPSQSFQLPSSSDSSPSFCSSTSSPAQAQAGASQSPPRVKSTPSAETQWEEESCSVSDESDAKLPQTSS